MNLVKDLPLFLQVSKKIEDDIVYGKFKPGDRLEEAELCEQYHVSRTPVREALKILASEGLVELRPRRGAVIPTLNLITLCEMFEFMAELEGMCGRLAARRIQDEEKVQLQAKHAECEKYVLEDSCENYYEANKQFHFYLYGLSRNSYLIEQATSLHNRLHPYRRLQLRVNNRMQHSFEEHRKIVEAIITSQEQLAENLLKAHVQIQGQKFSDLMASLNFIGNY